MFDMSEYQKRIDRFHTEVAKRLAKGATTPGEERNLGIIPGGPAYHCTAPYIHDGRRGSDCYEYNVGRDC